VLYAFGFALPLPAILHLQRKDATGEHRRRCCIRCPEVPAAYTLPPSTGRVRVVFRKSITEVFWLYGRVSDHPLSAFVFETVPFLVSDERLTSRAVCTTCGSVVGGIRQRGRHQSSTLVAVIFRLLCSAWWAFVGRYT